MTRPLRDARGFTIIETMAAILILAVAFLGFAGVHATSSKAQSLGENQVFATNVVDQQLEVMRRTKYTLIAAGSGSSTVQGIQFNFARSVSDVTNGKRVSVAATWTDRYGPHTLTIATVVSPVTNQ